MRQHSHTQRRPPPMPRLHRPPQPSEAEFRAARDKADLQEAAQWGYQPQDPATIGVAIDRLRKAARPDDAEQFQERRGPYEAQHRTDCANLARRLAEIQQRGAHLNQPKPEHPPMRITDAFPSNYLKASDLGGRAVKVIIADCDMEHLDDEQKPVLRFRGKQKGMVLNRTNGAVLAAALGDETTDWVGQEVELYPDRTMFQGRMVDCLRVRVPAPPPPSGGAADADIPW